MKSSLIKCNYPKALIQDGINKALAIDRKDLIHPTGNAGTNDNNSIPFVSTFNSNYHDNSTLVKDYFRRLKNSKSTKNIFESKNLIIAKRQPPNLRRELTNARFCDGGGVFKCNRARCKLCDIIITGNSFTFRPKICKFDIKSTMNCNTCNCIYVIECQGCSKLYIGETNNLRLRTNLHRDHCNKNIGLDVSRHIFSCTVNKSIKFKIMPFYKMTSNDELPRRNMEKYFINKFIPELNKWQNEKYV